MLLLVRPVESDAAEHVIGNIRELTWFRMFIFLSQFVRAAALYPSEELTLLVILIYSSLIGVTLHVFLVLTVSLCTMLHKITKCIIVVQNVMSVFSCIFEWSIYLFRTQRQVLIFSVVFLHLLTRSDGCLFECSHKSHNLKEKNKKRGERMIVILHHKAC